MIDLYSLSAIDYAAIEISVYASVLLVVRMFRLFFFQAEDGIRDLVRSRGLGDVYKRQTLLDSQQPARINKVRRLAFDIRIPVPALRIADRGLSLIHI